MIKKYILLGCIAALTLSSCGKAPVTEPKTAENLTVEEKVAQMLMVRCEDRRMKHILSLEPGGIVMFGVDFEGLDRDEVTAKIDCYKSALDIEPLIAVDEEGGTVVRVSSNPALSPEKYQSPRYYYDTGGLEAVLLKEAEKSDLLASLGITMNLAPVADISTDPDYFMYDRALGRGASATAEYISAVVETMHEHNMKSCLKHFPGYGGNLDTHTGIAVDDRPLSQFYENDFLPFKAGIEAGADAVLIAHNIITDADSSQPASISPAIHDILRNTLDYNGIIMTDDMRMGAMAEYSEPYKKAVLAGNDMIMVSDPDAAFKEILNAVKRGEIPMEMIDNAVSRILAAKNIKGSAD